ncbi:MAG: M1 family metallopeptidase [Verrucomicrobia bacterium]|nr:M1 family metallopeptidase [Verrucomicrobiota bacterium]
MNDARSPRRSSRRPVWHWVALAILAGWTATAATTPPVQNPALTPPAPEARGRDEHSHAQPDRVAIRHLALDLAVDFDRRVLSGTATLDLTWTDPAGTELVLDTRDLVLRSVEASPDGIAWAAVPFELAPADPILGSRLTIRLSRPAPRVRIGYSTSPGASGLQWLTPAMTLGRRLPFLFSQSQPIHARSWVPLQDTPSVRFTYEARITTTTDVRVLMSADNDPGAPRNRDYRFRMPQPIPSYLLAIAAGDLVFQAITPRIGIWAEPAMVSRAAHEFADAGRMMDTAERLYGPYRWERYDLLILPPSFPYGGMENPRLTFVSPTVITGDRSLVSLVAHELAHSWSGNLVTFSSNRDMWLNEGFTTYVEGRIIEELYGREWADMERLTARQELKSEFTDANRALQSLVIAPGALPDPDRHLTATVYTKGAWFLQFLEERIGRQDFDAFLRGYFDHFAFQSISTPQFLAYARTHLLERHPDQVRATEVDAWLYQPGVPDTAPATESPRLQAVDAARTRWLAEGTPHAASLTTGWSSQEWLHFLAGMPETLTAAQLRALDARFHFTGTSNVEIAHVWYPLTIRSGYLGARPAITEYLSRVGRRRMVLPLYRALARTPDGLAFAREVLASSRDNLHPITVKSIETVLAAAPASGAR